MALLSAALIAQELADRAEELVLALFPEAKRERHELRWHGRDGAVWSMRLTGSKAGVWASWGAPEHVRGDALELVHHSLFPDETGRRVSCQWAARWLGIEDAPDNSEMLLELRRRAFEAQQRRAQQRRAEEERMRRRALALYLGGGHSQPLPLARELVSYLHGRIGYPIEDLEEIPRALRFNPGVYYGDGLALPAMLAPVIDPTTRQQLATHATFLKQDESGGWRKTTLKPSKKVFGGYSGGLIPLLRGSSGQPLKDAPHGDVILIAEGIENALAASLVVDGAPRVVACVSVGNLPVLELPTAFTKVIVAYDRDGENEAVRSARERARVRWLAQGRAFNWIKPARGFKDFAEQLVEAGAQ